jgi:hypothetical protein
MIKRSVTAVLVAVFVLSGCYHAEVVTGKTPGRTVVEKPWAIGFLGGLIPPPVLDVEEECGSAGVAIVETEISIVNWLAQMITFSIISPMHITVTCADGAMGAVEDADVQIQRSATMEQREAALQKAVARSAETKAPVRIGFVD